MYSSYQVIITGGSSGIGAAFARYFCRQKKSILIVGRRPVSEVTFYESLNQEYPESHCDYLACDLTNETNIQNLVAIISQCPELCVLINNAGYTIEGRLLDNSIEEHTKLCNVHIKATLELTYAALPTLIEHSGSLINTASIAARIPTPLAPLYGATKAFIKSFTESVAASYKHLHVKAIVVCPGFTVTQFHDRLGINPSDIYKDRGPLKAWSADQVVERAMLDLSKGRVISTMGYNFKIISFVLKHTPDWITHKLAQRVRSARIGQTNASTHQKSP